MEARSGDASIPGKQSGSAASDLIRGNIKAVAQQTIEARAETASAPPGNQSRTVIDDIIRDNVKTVTERVVDARADNASTPQTSTLSSQNINSIRLSIKDVSIEISQGLVGKTSSSPANVELFAKSNIRPPRLSSYIATQIVEGIPVLQNDLPKLTSSVGVTDKYDESHLANENNLRAADAVSFGHAYSDMFQSTLKGRQLLIEYFAPKIKQSLEAPNLKNLISPTDTNAKTASMWEAFMSNRAVSLTADLLGKVGDVMDVLGVIMLFTDAFYMKPEFQVKLLTYESFRNTLKFSIDAQFRGLYGDASTGYRGYNDKCKSMNAAQRQGYPFEYATYPLISGPLDYLERGPGKTVYHSQARFKLELNSIREALLKDPKKPYKGKMQIGLGGDVYNLIVNDPKYKLWWYASGGPYSVLSLEDMDNLYREAFKTVCEYNKGLMYEDTHKGVDSDGGTDIIMDGRPRFQCGWKTASECVASADQWARDKGKSGGNYAEWYVWDDLVGSDGKLKVPFGHKLRSTPSVNGACVVTNSGIRQMCETSEGKYSAVTHTCTFTPQFCQDHGMCFNKTDQMCYLPEKAMQGFSAILGDYAPREYIKIYGCNVDGIGDMINFPLNILTGKGQEWFSEITRNKCIDTNFKHLLTSTATYPAGFATSSVGVALMTASRFMVIPNPVSIAVAVASLVAMGVAIGFDYGKQNQINGRFPPNDNNEYTVGGWSIDANGTKIKPKSLGFASGWITKPLTIKTVDRSRELTSFEDGVNSSAIPGLFTCKFFDDQGAINAALGASAGVLSTAVDTYLFGTKWPVKVTCHSGCQKSGGGTDKWVLQGTSKSGIRAASNGSADKIWCLPSFPDAVYADSLIGPLANEDADWNTNRVWTDGAEPSIAQYPTGEKVKKGNSCVVENNLSGPAFKGGDSYNSIRQWRYQLVYRKDPTDSERTDPNSQWWNSATNMPRKIWDTNYLRTYFTDSRINEMRRYYCQIAFTQNIQSKTPFDQKCYGYVSFGLDNYVVLPMTLTSTNKRGVVPDQPCMSGFFKSPSGCLMCPSGTYIPSSSKTCITCPTGTFSGAGETSCTKCPIGTYSSTTQATSVAACISCPPGTYSATPGSAACTLCPAGYMFAGTNGTTKFVCNPCTKGTYSSSEGASVCSPCAVGTYSDLVAAASCKQCPAFKANSRIGSTSISDCQNCPIGSSYQLGLGCVPCSPGTIGTTYSDLGSYCQAVPIGTYTDTPSSTSYKFCPVGTRGKSGILDSTRTSISTACETCPAGTYSSITGQAACTSCPSGTYSAITGATSLTSCLSCPAGTRGKAGISGGTTILEACETCPVGTYSIAGTSGCQNCPAGTYSTTTGANSLTSCLKCPVGTYSTSTGANSLTSCLKCPAGKYSDVEGQTGCTSCPGGTYSAIIGATSATTCLSCPAGKYSTSIGATSATTCLSCPAGTYSATQGQTACTPCNNYTVSGAGAISCTICPAGLSGNNTLNATYCVNVDAGYFNDGTGVKVCPRASYSVSGARSCTLCDQGYSTYVTPATLATDCTPCGAGKYGTGPGAGCTNCPAGTYSTTVRATSVGSCIQCPVNTISSAGASSCTPCGTGFTSDGKTCYCSSPKRIYKDYLGRDVCA